MQNFSAYQFFLCFFVIAILTVIFTAMTIYVVKVNCRFIALGAEDEKLKIEYEKQQARKQSLIAKIMDKIALVFFTLIFFALFTFGVVITVRENTVIGKIPTLKVVQTGSMSYVNEYNKYLKEGEVEDHIQAFDLIVVHELPKVEDLKVKDIVLYEIDGYLLVHRIVGIELPNEEHPDEIHFLLHGDANELPDKFPVKYEQMRGIYRGERIPYIGTFVSFIQSPAGYLCMLIVIFATFAVPFAEKKIEKKKVARLVEIGVINEEGDVPPVDNASPAEEVAFESAIDEQAVTAVEANVLLAVSKESPFASFGKPKSFEEKLSQSGELASFAYDEVVLTLCRIDKIRAIRGFKGETYRCKNKAVCKLTIRGKTLNVFLALSPQEFENTKYRFEDVSESKAYANYPMRLKLTSKRQIAWAKELILTLADKNGFAVAKEPITNLKDLFGSFKKAKSFQYKLRTANETLKARYKEITTFLNSFEKIRVIRGKKGETYKRGSVCVCKLTIRGKTLNAHIGLEPKKFENTKYIFKDLSESKVYANYPMRVKVSSDRQVRWVKELLLAVLEQKGGAK